MSEPPGGRSDSFRGFVALPLPKELREGAEAAVERLRSGGDVRWTAMENFHLTLKFLGAVPRSSLPRLTAALGEAAAGAAPFSLSLGGLGAFPRPEKPRVVWIAVCEGETPLEALAARVEAACAEVGFAPEERAYRAHLTLGRARGDAPPRGLAERLRAAEPVELGGFQAERFHLMQSDLTPHGPIYSVVETFQLGSPVREGAPVG